MKTDIFCVLRLLELECKFKPLDKVSFIETLMDAYNIFPTELDSLRI